MENDEMARLEDRQFLMIEDHVFFFQKSGDEQRIANLIRERGTKNIQRMMNHEHLGFYTRNPGEQRVLGLRIQQLWKGRLARLFPAVSFDVQCREEGGEFVLFLHNS